MSGGCLSNIPSKGRKKPDLRAGTVWLVLKSQKGRRVWLMGKSTGLACMRPWTPTPGLKGQGEQGEPLGEGEARKQVVCLWIPNANEKPGKDVKGYN